jgi:diacylglycerol kinase family enzyme
MKLEHQRVIRDDGYFEMLLIPNPKSPGDLNNILLALLNQEYDRGGLVFRHVKQVRIETEEELPWSLDGEYAPTQPVVTIENLQQALTFLL